MIDDVSTCYAESHQLVQNIRKMVGPERLANRPEINWLTEELATHFLVMFCPARLTENPRAGWGWRYIDSCAHENILRTCLRVRSIKILKIGGRL